MRIRSRNYTLITLFIAVLASTIPVDLFCQIPTIVRQSGNSASVYTNLQLAIDESEDGDILYLSGGSFENPNGSVLTISKSLSIIGVGMRPDSTLSTTRTQISEDIELIGHFNHVHFEGIHFIGSIRLMGSANIESLNFNRCNFRFTQSGSSGAILLDVLSFNECVVRSLGLSWVSNVSARNSFIESCVQARHTVIAQNCIFTYNTSCFQGLFGDCQQVTLVDCIFSRSTTFSLNPSDGGPLNIANCIFLAPTVTMHNATQFNVQFNATNIFLEEVGATYEYLNNYEINPSSTAYTWATDGGQVGIYGGHSPWKQGSIPHHPYIMNGSFIEGLTNPDGTLPVHLKVQAQDR